MNSLLLSVVIPVFNEEKRIGKSLKKLAQFLKNRSHQSEVLIVDDGSEDKTPEIAQEWAGRKSNWQALRLKNHQGKGAAVKKGVLEAQGKYILFTDADLPVALEELGKFLKAMERYDVAVASKHLALSKNRRGQRWFLRSFLSQIFNFLVRALLLLPYSDTQCGFKMFKNEVAKKIFSQQKIKGLCFDVEILYLAKRAEFKVCELPVTWNYAPGSSVSIGMGLRMFYDLLKIRWRKSF